MTTIQIDEELNKFLGKQTELLANNHNVNGANMLFLNTDNFSNANGKLKTDGSNVFTCHIPTKSINNFVPAPNKSPTIGQNEIQPQDTVSIVDNTNNNTCVSQLVDKSKQVRVGY